MKDNLYIPLSSGLLRATKPGILVCLNYSMAPFMPRWAPLCGHGHMPRVNQYNIGHSKETKVRKSGALLPKPTKSDMNDRMNTSSGEAGHDVGYIRDLNADLKASPSR